MVFVAKVISTRDSLSFRNRVVSLVKILFYFFTGIVNTENVSQTDRWSLVRSTPAQKFGVAGRI